MAVTKNIVKNDHMRAVVHISGTAAGDTTSVTLASLVNTAQSETSSGTLKAKLAYAWATCDNAASSVTVTRNSTKIIQFNGYAEWPASQQLPALAIQEDQDFTVTFNSPGVIILDIRKGDGYVSPNTNVGV